MTNIILCGGNGTRLWPLSRTLMPKQFVKLFNDKSIFQLTVERNSEFCDTQYIVSNIEQQFLAQNQLNALGRENSKYLLEPVGRNTAPAIALACFDLPHDEVVLVTPSDHLIKNKEAYGKVLKRAIVLAEKNTLVTFGITPAFAETGFGYIEAEDENVLAFHEKPDAKTAEGYVKAGNYYWNSGMFCFQAGVFLNELKRLSPKIYESSLKAYEHTEKNDMVYIAKDDMLAIPEDSIDYAVMEKSNIVKVVPSDIDWSDMGSFDALAQELRNDENNNLILSEKPVELIDIKDTVIVDTGDVLLISKKGKTQEVKKIVERLKEEGSQLPVVHLTGYRPWGSYTVLEEGNGYKIKRIIVETGKRISLQKHFHRSEHWVVLSGSATVTINDKVFTVNPNESTYIKAGDIHRLENQGKLPLVIIETQVGEYTGEDDIVRLDDDYKRI